jgi:Common central domain of tyrosinase/Polyphenol oxidase middle domain
MRSTIGDVMAFTRQDVWALSAKKTWPDALEWYAKGVRVMQGKALEDPTSWAYQSAIHGLANTPPPPGAPWNECQHGSWYFTPWHRMYLYHFEAIVRDAVIAEGGPQDWSLPYWNYERSTDALKIPPAFTEKTLPDGSDNPLRLANRRPDVNAGKPMLPQFASSTETMSDTYFTTPVDGTAGGFGGPETKFHHGFDGLAGDLEYQPHNIIHGWVGGLMNNPDTAALDPIFWLHHANIDRLWETWRITVDANPTSKEWLNKKFKLRDKSGAAVEMAVSDVLKTTQLHYAYDKLPAVPAVAAIASQPKGTPMPSRKQVKTIAQRPDPLELGRDGASTDLKLGGLPPAAASAVAGEPPRFHLRLADITGVANPDIIYGVYINPPANASEAALEKHRVGIVSFFGIEHTTKAGSKDPKPLSYSFDVTDVVSPLVAGGALPQLRVSLLPMGGTEKAAGAGAVAAPPINIGTVAFNVADG